MTKVQLNKLEKTLYTIAAVFALAAIILIVGASVVPTDATRVKQKIDAGFYGYDIVFGLKDGDIYGLKFSFLALLPYIFTLAGMVLLVFRILDKYVSRKFDFLIAGIFLVAALLYFLSNNFLVFTDNLVGELFGSFKYRISYGTIISGTLSVLAGGLAATSYVLEEFVTITENKDVEVKEETKKESKETTLKTEEQESKETKKKEKKSNQRS